MSHLKICASPLAGRALQLFTTSALAVSTFVGGATLLGGGSARAMSMFPPVPVGTMIENGASFEGISGPTPPSTGSVEFDYIGLLPNVPNSNLLPTYVVDTDFNPNFMAPYTGEISYKLTAPEGESWLYAALSQNIVAPFSGAEVTKLVCHDPQFSVNCTTIPSPPPLFDSDFTPFVSIVPAPTIYVKDTYVGIKPAILDNFINSFQTVPGPLPILGAGAAFGFSRKLRSRIKAARLS